MSSRRKDIFPAIIRPFPRWFDAVNLEHFSGEEFTCQRRVKEVKGSGSQSTGQSVQDSVLIFVDIYHSISVNSPHNTHTDYFIYNERFGTTKTDTIHSLKDYIEFRLTGPDGWGASESACSSGGDVGVCCIEVYLCSFSIVAIKEEG